MASTVEIRNGIEPKKFFPNSRHIIEYAFSIKDQHYFKFSEHLNLPYERALSCLVFYKELDMNVDRDFLKQHCDAIDKILLGNPIDVFKIKNLNDLMVQRLNLPKDPELMYKLASVVYFDQSESPEVYEYMHGKKKIDFWKENTTLTDFFLSKPLRELIPYIDYAGENIETFSRMVEEKKKTHLAKVSAQ